MHSFLLGTRTFPRLLEGQSSMQLVSSVSNSLQLNRPFSICIYFWPLQEVLLSYWLKILKIPSSFHIQGKVFISFWKRRGILIRIFMCLRQRRGHTISGGTEQYQHCKAYLKSANIVIHMNDKLQVLPVYSLWLIFISRNKDVGDGEFDFLVSNGWTLPWCSAFYSRAKGTPGKQPEGQRLCKHEQVLNIPETP